VRAEENNSTREPGKGKTIRAANLAQNMPSGGRPIKKSMPTKKET